MAAGVNQTALGIVAERAFPKLMIERPVVLTNAGDGSNRLFVAGQLGKVFALAARADLTEPQLFLDIEDRVTYKDTENEEGLLGLAFHPKFKENGEFFVYYTAKSEPHLSIISRFKTQGSNRAQGDPASEQILMTIKQPFWNHNGGTLEFGKDGYLYIGLGDGGKRDDPLQAAQDVTTLLGKVLRIDVDHQSPGLPYAIPHDNPLVKTPGARAEIYAIGFRNPWRISFDRVTGQLWCADVGQDMWEEISLVHKGGNYGWSVREATHKFGPKGSDAIPQMTEPVWSTPIRRTGASRSLAVRSIVGKHFRNWSGITCTAITSPENCGHSSSILSPARRSKIAQSSGQTARTFPSSPSVKTKLAKCTSPRSVVAVRSTASRNPSQQRRFRRRD